LVKEQDGNLKFQGLLSKILMQKRSYEEALKPLQYILSKDETNMECICNIAHCHFWLKRTKEAEEAYIKSIRVSSFTGQRLEDPYVRQRLGSLYI
jgi:tetratricopeptide (TPR) repeat protein